MASELISGELMSLKWRVGMAISLNPCGIPVPHFNRDGDGG